MSQEVSRSNDDFIQHHFKVHNGEIPLWVQVEVMSFGTLSKIIKNLEKDSYRELAHYYKYISINGNYIVPSIKTFSSWIYSVSVLRNICAHNGRIYNRTMNITPEILKIDKYNKSGRIGVYPIILAMKYLRPTNGEWEHFIKKLISLFEKYKDIIKLSCMSFPRDWEMHLNDNYMKSLDESAVSRE